MIIEVGMKTPDCLFYAIEDLDVDQRAEIVNLCDKWFKYKEAVTLVIDTEKKTCTVKEL